MRLITNFYSRFREILTYAVVGGIAILMQNLCYWLCYHYLLLNPPLAMFMAKILGVSLSYLGHFKYTFQQRKHMLNIILKHIAVTIFGFIFAVGGVQILTGILKLNPLWGIAISVISSLINYLLTKFWTFRAHSVMAKQN